MTNRVELEARLVEVFAAESRAAWLEAFRAVGVPAGPLLNLDEVFVDPQVMAREMVTEVEHPSAGTVRLLASPLLREETPVGAPPPLGERGEVMATRWLNQAKSKGTN